MGSEMCIRDRPCTDQWISDPSMPVLLSIGRLSPQKDFANLLEAFALVVKTRPVKLIILGEGELRKNLEALIGNLKITEHVKMPGFVENPYCYMRNAQVFVLSSQWEGLPTVLIEALFCGIRLVSTDCPHGPKEILLDGEYGVLISPKDSKGLAHGIIKALDKDSATISNESWEPYTLDYSIEHYLSYILEKSHARK